MNCTLCPRKCKVDRNSLAGFCGAGKYATVAKIMLHKWEEPCICYAAGSGAVFFSGCQLKCVFCQNHEISSFLHGEEFDSCTLCDVFLSLEENGACNINLVSPTPHLFTLIPALEMAKTKGLSIPVLFNSGGYEEVESIRALDGLIDIYLPDFKFFDPALALKLARAKDYPEVAAKAIEEMQKQVGKPVWNGDLLASGVMIRHLILPGHTADSVNILKMISSLFKENKIVLSLLRQYTPTHHAAEIPGLNRPITTLEYKRVVQVAENYGFQWIYTQKKESVGTEFIPDFSSDSNVFS